MTFDKLLDEVSSSCGVGRAPVKASIEGLLDRMQLFMEYGMSVRLGDFGTFKPMINVKAQSNLEDVGASNVWRRKIRFIPGKRFKDMLEDLFIMTVHDAAATKLPDDETTPDGEDEGDIIDPDA